MSINKSIQCQSETKLLTCMNETLWRSTIVNTVVLLSHTLTNWRTRKLHEAILIIVETE